MPQLILSLLIANYLNSLKVFPQVFKMTSFCYKSAKMMLRSSLSIIDTIWGLTLATYRSSRIKLFCIKAALNGFAKFTGKCLFPSLFFIKNADSGLLLYYKRDFQCFRVNFAKFFKNSFFTEHWWWLLLHVYFKVIMILLNSNNQSN